MKRTFNVILALLVIGLLVICYKSINGPIQFNNEKDAREAAVKARLIDIRTAEEQFKTLHGQYCDSFSVLIDFIKNGKIPSVMKVGELTDAQMDKGLTEAKAAAIVRSGNAAAIAANGLQDFKRDTVWTSLGESLFGKGFNADSLEFIPFSNGEKFELATTIILSKSGTEQYVMECKAPYSSYLKGMNEREVYNLTDAAEKKDAYAGLKIGDLYSSNNNAGSWE